MRLTPIIATILIILSGIFYYNLSNNQELQTVTVSKVTDGDTIEITLGQKLRLKGINTPEKSMPGFNEAKQFLEERVLDKQVKIRHYGEDKYKRILSYIFLDDQNINEEILSNGLGTLYFYEHDEYYEDLKLAEANARQNQKGIWKESSDAHCLELVQLKYKEDGERCTNKEVLELKNNCDKILQVIIKDDATHIYHETIKPLSTFTKNFSCIWNDAGDSVYIFDEQGLLIFHRY